MSEPVYKALLGALLRVNGDRYPLVEVLEKWLEARGLSDYGHRILPLAETVYKYRILRENRFTEIGYVIGKKNIPLKLEDILKELL